MKKFLFFVVAVSLYATSALAQQGPKLNDQQMEEMNSLLQTYWSQVMEQPAPNGGVSTTQSRDERPRQAEGRDCEVVESRYANGKTFQMWKCRRGQ